MAEHRTSDERLKRPRIAAPDYDVAALRRLMTYVDWARDDCWRWLGAHGPTGYGLFQYRDVSMNAHRAMYQLHHGVKLTTEQYVLHRCDVRDCVNPAHLWIGTAKDNNADCARKGRHYEGSRTHCERGHPFAGDNLRVGTQKGGRSIRRVCVTCERLRAQGLV